MLTEQNNLDYVKHFFAFLDASAIPATSLRATAETVSTSTSVAAVLARAASAPTPTGDSSATALSGSASGRMAERVPTRYRGCATRLSGMDSALIRPSKWYPGNLQT